MAVAARMDNSSAVSAPPAPFINAWPALLNREQTLAFSGLSESVLRRCEREGKISFKALGPHGSHVVPREQVETLLRCLWAEAVNEPIDDMDMGDDGDC